MSESPIREVKPNVFAKNPAAICGLNPFLDEDPAETFSNVAAVFDLVEEVEILQPDDVQKFNRRAEWAWCLLLRTAKVALKKQVEILRERDRAGGDQS